jgi:aromatic ring-opening dioxygenase catalytic subunit (LigB family)
VAERRVYELTDEQHARLLKASDATPAMWLSGGQPMFPTPEENADAEWKRLGEELGFIWDTARPVHGKSDHFFSAEPMDA